MSVAPTTAEAAVAGGTATLLLRPRAAFIVGPTGVGKSAFALALAERLGGEIVNADSRQVYQAMDLGTAKPTIAERRRAPHHLIDLYPPDKRLDAAEFARRARAAIHEIAWRGRPVLVVGGSGLYLRALRAGLCAGPPASPGLRATLRTIADREGLAALHARLAACDPAAAARISPNDRQRIVRALEVFELTGVPLSAAQAAHQFAEQPFTTLTIGLTLPRKLLYEVIDRRFVAMMEAGLLDEVRGLRDRGLARGAALTTIGYRELAAHLEGALSLPEAIRQAQQASRRLAKRQLTWVHADPETRWMDPREGIEPAARLLHNFFNRPNAIDG
jgi:tRNA dimethylallyltransferase